MQIFEFTINLLTKNEINKTPEEISLKLKEIIPNSFSSMNNINNIPLEFSNDVPFLTSKSLDNYIIINVMKKKISIKFNIKDDKIDSDLKDYFKDEYFEEKIKPIFIFFQEYEIIRIGLISTFFLEDLNGTDILKEKFFKDDFIVNSDLSIKYNVIDNDKYGFSTNNLNTIQVAEVSYGANVNFKKGIVLQKDINNIETNGFDFNIQKFEDFLSKVLEEISFSSIENKKYY